MPNFNYFFKIIVSLLYKIVNFIDILLYFEDNKI